MPKEYYFYKPSNDEGGEHVLNPNPNKLYVGNLPFRMTREELMQAFAAAGKVVDATIIVNKYTGRSKGFGFVEMSTPEEAHAAKEQFHGKDLGGRVLIVNEARPETPRDEQAADGSQPAEEMPIVEAAEDADDEKAK